MFPGGPSDNEVQLRSKEKSAGTPMTEDCISVRTGKLLREGNSSVVRNLVGPLSLQSFAENGECCDTREPHPARADA